jgi:hypothetical protein
MNTLLVWALVVLAPLSGVRMICLDPDSLDAGRERAAAAVLAAEEAHCQQTCALHARHGQAQPPAPAAQPAPAPRPSCFFVADTTCELAMSTGIAVVPQPASLVIARIATPIEPTLSPATYLAPVLSPPGPPPKV